MRTFIIFSILLILAKSASVCQTTGIKKYNNLSGKIGFTLEGGSTYSLTDFREARFSYLGRLLFDYFFPSSQAGIWGLRGHAFAGYIEGSGGATSSRPELMRFKTTVVSLGGGGEYLLSFSNVVMPYVYAGAAYLYYDPRDNSGNRLERNEMKKYSRHEWMLLGELGFRFLVSKNVSLNLGANINYVNSDNIDDVVAGSDNDIFFSGFGGISVYFGGTSDKDGDGVNDDDDLCPETPKGIIVDQFGCPIDNDNDGIPDYLDKCINTPANIPVDNNGCPVDADGDGIPDYLDLCRETPEGVPVDKRGCPYDEDEDGVPDYMDNCPGTKLGIEVNRWGCPSEALNKELPEITAMVLSGDVNFDVGKSNLLPGAKAELDKLINAMKKNPETMWKIEGHTDITGSYSLNKRLSYERALSVADYLNSNGISRTRLELDGLGPDFPVADNSTESGRTLNRRVTITLIDGESTGTTVIPGSEYNVKNEFHAGNMIFTDGNLYCIQVSSFRIRSRAEKEVQRLREMGEKAFIIEANLPELNGTWFRVRIGYFNSLNEAKLKKEKILR